MSDHREQLVRLLELVQQEQARRQAARVTEAEQVERAIEELLGIYDAMEQRLRGTPRWDAIMGSSEGT